MDQAMDPGTMDNGYPLVLARSQWRRGQEQMRERNIHVLPLVLPHVPAVRCLPVSSRIEVSPPPIDSDGCRPLANQRGTGGSSIV